MALKPLAVAVALAAVTTPLCAQESSWIVSLGFRGSLTTTAKLFYLPEDPSEFLRSRFEPLKNIPGAALDARVRPPGSSFFFTLSAEYQRKTLEQRQLLGFTSPPSVLPTEDGYWMIPIEATVNVDVPLGAERFALTMGAGFGVYYAERLLSVAGIPATPVDVTPALGLTVRTSADYRLTDWVTVLMELRFRNPQITTVNRFEQRSTTVDGVVIVFPQEDIPGRLGIEGMVVSLGVVVDLR